MNNESTPTFYQPPQGIDYTVMGHDKITSDFLNWCLSQRDNLEFIKQCGTLEKKSQQSSLHSDHLGVVKEIDDVVKHRKS